MFGLLRQRNFALLWVGGLISMIGNWVSVVALPFYIYERTGSALASSSLLIAYVLPFLLFGSMAGVFVDRWDRKRTMVIANLLQAAFTLLLLLMVSIDLLWIAYLVAFIESTISTFSGPAENALLPNLVGKEHLQPANVMNTLNNNLARLIGPPLGGVLIGVLGLNGVVVLNSASFLIAAIFIAFITAQTKPEQSAGKATVEAASKWQAFWNEWRSGLQLAWSDYTIASLFIIASIFTLGDSILSALLVPFMDDVVKAGALGFGLLLTVRGVGGLLGSVVVGYMGRRIPPIFLLAFGNISTGLLLLIEFNVPIFTLVLVLGALMGVTVVAAITSQSTLFQENVPDEYRGRIFGSLGSTGALLRLVGTAMAGFFADRVGIVPILNISGALTVLAGVMTVFLLMLRHHKRTAPDLVVGPE